MKIESGPRLRIVSTTVALLMSAAAVCAQTPPDSTATPGSPAASTVAPTPQPGTGTQPNAGANVTSGAATQPAGAGAAPSGLSPVAAVAPSVVNPNNASATAAAEAEALQKRMERARALAAAHQLSAAAMELESVRATAKDEMYRNVSSLMLMGIYLEDGNYARAESMLEETFKLRSAKSEGSVRTYFALAGQAVNGARAHVGRYRSFGINVANPALPAEATADLDRLRSLLERMSAQAKDLLQQNTRDNDAFALLEDIAGIRTTIARDNEDRTRWQNEYSAARAKLATLPVDATANNQSFPNRGNSDVTKSSAPESVVDNTLAREPAQNTVKAVTPTVDPGNSSVVAARPASALLEVGSLYEKATKKVEPTYPQIAKNTGVSGLVRVKLVIDESGSVSNIVWTEGPLVLRQAAQDAVRQWKFQPVVIDGKPVRAAGYVDFGFSR